jgi:hypothetical protein
MTKLVRMSLLTVGLAVLAGGFPQSVAAGEFTDGCYVLARQAYLACTGTTYFGTPIMPRLCNEYFYTTYNDCNRTCVSMDRTTGGTTDGGNPPVVPVVPVIPNDDPCARVLRGAKIEPSHWADPLLNDDKWKTSIAMIAGNGSGSGVDLSRLRTRQFATWVNQTWANMVRGGAANRAAAAATALEGDSALAGQIYRGALVELPEGGRHR